MTYARQWLGVALMALLVGCANLGLPAADTFNKKAAAAYNLNYQVRDTGAELLRAGKITKAEGQKVLDVTDATAASIEAARAVNRTNPAEADNRLNAIRTGLLSIQAFLASKGGR